MAIDNLEEVIENATSDAELPPEPVEIPDVETPEPEPSPEPTDTPVTGDLPFEPKTDADAPAAQPAKPVDDFEKKFGIPALSSTGRENRIPYSRVKKISEKAAAEARKETEATFTPKVTEYEGKIKTYEERLERVDRFEEIMAKDPDKFLNLLSQLPVYAPFFKAVRDLAEGRQPEAQATPQTPEANGRPAPDQKLSDGTMVYSMEGLDALMAWQADQIEKRVTKQVEERYKPIESEWQAHQHMQQVLPQVKAQITEARTWAHFTDNETEIVEALKKNKSWSLERAYQSVVYPKIVADREKMRAELLKEVKQAPIRSTSVSAQATKAGTPASSGPRDLEDVIREATKGLQ